MTQSAIVTTIVFWTVNLYVAAVVWLRFNAGGTDALHPYVLLNLVILPWVVLPPSHTWNRDLLLGSVRMHRRLRRAGVRADWHVWPSKSPGGIHWEPMHRRCLRCSPMPGGLFIRHGASPCKSPRLHQFALLSSLIFFRKTLNGRQEPLRFPSSGGWWLPSPTPLIRRSRRSSVVPRCWVSRRLGVVALPPREHSVTRAREVRAASHRLDDV